METPESHQASGLVVSVVTWITLVVTRLFERLLDAIGGDSSIIIYCNIICLGAGSGSSAYQITGRLIDKLHWACPRTALIYQTVLPAHCQHSHKMTAPHRRRTTPVTASASNPLISSRR
jgi:hypothetical protein